MKDVLIVSEDIVGIMALVLQGMKDYTDLSFDYIDHYAVRHGFRYRSLGHRAQNLFLKTFRGRNLKSEYYENSLAKAIEELEPSYKKILVIRPDRLSDNHLQMLRQRTSRFIAYYWDSTAFFPRKLAVTHYFDRILSFDHEDCRRYGFELESNFYYYEDGSLPPLYQVYNLSSYDARRPLIEAIAKQLDAAGISYCFKAFFKKPFANPYIRYTPRMSYSQMINEIRQAEVVLDATKKGQNGLTFRPFEALGLNKKLITTNAYVKEYPFYNPANILVVDPASPDIDPAFFDSPYIPPAPEVRAYYHLKSWLYRVLEMGQEAR